MKRFLLHKAMQFLSALFLLVVFSFAISRLIPGDPAKHILKNTNTQGKTSHESRLKRYEQLYRQMGLHLPLFYFSIESFAVPDTFHRVPFQEQSSFLCALAYYSGNPEGSLIFVKAFSKKNNIPHVLKEIKLKGLEASLDEFFMDPKLKLETRLNLNELWSKLKSESENNSWKRWMPCIRFNSRNQFNTWCFGDEFSLSESETNKGIIHGDFGVSWSRGNDVVDAVRYPFLLTMLISVFVLIVCFPLSLLCGALLTMYQHHFLAKIQRPILIFLYSIPTFWMGTALILFFSNPNMFNVFPSVAPLLNTNEGFGKWLSSVFSQPEYFIIPMFAIGYSTFVFISQMTEDLLRDEMQKPYVMTLKAVGNSERRIIFYYAMKNVLVPLIVAGMSVFPLLLSGTVIIDFLFTLPGIGTLIATACLQQDFPVIAAIIFSTGLFSILSFILTDILIRRINPLQQYNSK